MLEESSGRRCLVVFETSDYMLEGSERTTFAEGRSQKRPAGKPAEEQATNSKRSKQSGGYYYGNIKFLQSLRFNLQQSGDNCILLSVTQCVEALYYMKNQVRIKLSTGYLMQNAVGKKGYLSLRKALTVAKHQGIPLDFDYSMSFYAQSLMNRVNILNFVRIGAAPDYHNRIRGEIKEHPIIGVFQVLYNSFHEYKGGIYRPKHGEKLQSKELHSMVMTGWGKTKEGEWFWRVRNCWGQSFGEKGCMRISAECDVLVKCFVISGVETNFSLTKCTSSCTYCKMLPTEKLTSRPSRRSSLCTLPTCIRTGC